MTFALIAASILAAVLFVWWLADHRRGIEWARRAVRRSFPEVPSITAADLRQWLDDENRASPLLLDVRSAEEFAVSHLQGARRVDPDAGARDISGATDGPGPLVLYCAGGYRAARMSRRLLQAGRRDVMNLDGGIFAWVNAGHPVERDGKPVAQVHPVSRLFRRLLRKSAR